MAVAWIVVAIIFGLLEVATVAFFAAFIAIGAVAAAITAFLGASVVVQLLAFGVVSLLGVVVLRPFALRRLRSHIGPRLASGAEGMIGQKAVVVDAIEGSLQPGHVLISGERWPAVSGNGISIESGKTVVVVELRQATLVVAPD